MLSKSLLFTVFRREKILNKCQIPVATVTFNIMMIVEATVIDSKLF